MSLKRWAFVAGLGVVFSVTAYAAILLYWPSPITLGNIDKAGTFGDSFGVLTSLFSGLAFAGIVFTVLLQREELSLQREELRLTRDEIKNQNDAIKHQNFESTFFQMLRLHNDIVSSIDIRAISGDVTSGRDCFTNFSTSLTGTYRNFDRIFGVHDDLDERQRTEIVYREFWKQNQYKLGHYFRYLYTVFKFIKESEVENKRLYTNMVRAQLSDHELLLLFYNCLYKYGVEKFKPIAEKFALFDNLEVGQLLSPEHRDFYSPSAFGD